MGGLNPTKGSDGMARFYLFLTISSLLWAGNFVAGKFLIGHASALTITDMRWALADIFLIPLVVVIERKLFPPFKALIPLAVMALTGVIFFNFFIYQALHWTTADNVGLLSALNPIAIAIASGILLRERLVWRQILGMMVSFVGVVIVVTRGNGAQLLHFQVNTGVLLMFGSIAAWGLYAVAGRWAMKSMSAYMATLWAGILGVIFMVPFNVGDWHVSHAHWPFWASMGYTAIGGTVIAMVFWNMGVQHVGGTRSGMFLNFNPIFTAVLAYLLMGEMVFASQLIGTAIVIIGVLIFSISRITKPSAGEEEKEQWEAHR